jgi:hypothetical protein
LPGSVVVLWRRQDGRDERQLEEKIRRVEREYEDMHDAAQMPILRRGLCELLGCKIHFPGLQWLR